jgi:hypothetical protein
MNSSIRENGTETDINNPLDFPLEWFEYINGTEPETRQFRFGIGFGRGRGFLG